MQRSNHSRSFALVVTLVLLVLIAIIVVGYLGITRSDRASTSIYANRLRAKMMADSGLAAATKLLYDNTKHGNYITAMPAPVPAPAPLRTELYRPDDSAIPDDYLRLDNAVGEILASRVDAAPLPAPAPQIDPRPVQTPMPAPTAGNSFGLVEPGATPSTANSFDFNQIVRVGNNNTGRIVDPDGRPAFGQWIRVRDTAGEIIGRYAFFIEDESMKVNVNTTGNNLGPSSSNLRISDLPPSTGPTPPISPLPQSQIQEIDPSAILSAAPGPTPNRAAAVAALTGLGIPGARLASKPTLALISEWGSAPAPTPFSSYAHLITTVSADDNTTAKGWQRLNLNAIVADAEGIGTNAAKVAAATKIADWIRDAWTGSTLFGSLQDHQMFRDERLRKQIAANIVDYIDVDSTPTDMGDIASPGFPTAVPVIGIEKTPYLAAVEIIYQASDSTYPGSGTGTFSATLKMKIQFRFLNLFESTLDLTEMMGNTARSRIEVDRIPVIQKNNGPSNTVYDVSSQTWTVKLSDLAAVNGTDTTVPPGIDGQSDSGARTFQTNWLDTKTVFFNVNSADQNPKFAASGIKVRVFGNETGNASDDYRVDDTAIVTNSTTTGYQYTNGSASGDFLKSSSATTGPLQIASINYVANYQNATYVAGAKSGDARYRGSLLDERWDNSTSRTDATGPGNRIDSYIDKAEINPRSYGVDWSDYAGARPLAFIRDGPMLNIGELGNVAACEYPWRTLYLQYPERPPSTVTAAPATEIPLRRNSSVDYVLVDLFRTDGVSPRAGAININTQQRYGTTQQQALAPLLFGLRVPSSGGAVTTGAMPSLTQAIVDRFSTSTGNANYSTIFERRTAVGSPPDNTPRRPFFQIGELASVMSRLVNSSVSGSGTTGTPGRSTVSYCLLRNNPTQANEAAVNTNIHVDFQVEQEFREISNSITTRGNVFRVLYVGQSLKNSLVRAEYLGEAFIERQGVVTADPTNPDIKKMTDSTYKIRTTRIITE